MPKKTTTKTVVIIIPTYNERENVSKLVPILTKEIFPTLPKKYDPYILIVDDTSPDGTATEVRKLQKSHKQLKLKVNKQKGGLGKAYISGMTHALEKLNADIVFEFDADLSHDPKKIKPMLAKISNGDDLVLGSRYIKGGSIPDDWGLHRKFFSVVGNLFINFVMFDFSIRDWTTGYRAITREVVEKILPEMTDEKFTGYTFQIGFLHKTIRSGFNVGEVPLKFIDREIGNSKLGPEYIKNTLRFILKVRAQEITNHRLFKFASVGAIGALIQLSTLQLFRLFLGYVPSYFISVELAVLSNFIFSNFWTFADRKLQASQIPVKFFQFNLASAGSVLIQLILAWVVENYVGLFRLFTLPVVNIPIDTGLVSAVVGILIGMVWNYMAYTLVIWKKKE